MSPSDETPWVFTEWAIVAPRHAAPEVRLLSVRGKLNGRVVTSPDIIGKVGPMTYATKGGQVIRLHGPPEAGFAEFCRLKGIELDLNDPIKFRNTTEVFQWDPGKLIREELLRTRGVKTGLPPTSCPKCRAVLDATLGVGRALKPGDGAVCVDCGSLLIIDERMGVRLATDADEDRLGAEDQLLLRCLRQNVAEFNAHRAGVSDRQRGPHAG